MKIDNMVQNKLRYVFHDENIVFDKSRSAWWYDKSDD